MAATMAAAGGEGSRGQHVLKETPRPRNATHPRATRAYLMYGVLVYNTCNFMLYVQ